MDQKKAHRIALEKRNHVNYKLFDYILQYVYVHGSIKLIPVYYRNGVKIMTKFARMLIWLRSKRAAYYTSIIVIVCIECVLSWRASMVYYDSFLKFSNNEVVTAAISFVAFIAVLLSGSIISVHRPKSRVIFGLLAFFAVTHDIGGVFFSVFQNTLEVTNFSDFMGQITMHPGNALLVASLSSLGLIPLTLSSVLDEWYSTLETELEDQHKNFKIHAIRAAEMLVIQKFHKMIKKKKLEDLIQVIEDSKIRDMLQVVTGTTIITEDPSHAELPSPIDEEEDDGGLYIVEAEEETEEEQQIQATPEPKRRGRPPLALTQGKKPLKKKRRSAS